MTEGEVACGADPPKFVLPAEDREAFDALEAELREKFGAEAGPRYFDPDGNRLSLADWCELSANLRADPEGEWKIGFDTVINAEDETFQVSTVWIGLDHALSFGRGTSLPLIFETAVFSADGDRVYLDRYSTKEAAAEGHRYTILRVKRGEEG